MLQASRPPHTFGLRKTTILLFVWLLLVRKSERAQWGWFVSVWASPGMTQRPGDVSRGGGLKSFEGSLALYLVDDDTYQAGPQLDCLLEHLDVVSPCGCLGFPTTWWLGSKNKHPERTRRKLCYLL